MASKCKSSHGSLLFEGVGNERYNTGPGDPGEETEQGLPPLPGRRSMKGGCRKTSLMTEVERDRKWLFLEIFRGGC